MIRSFATLAIVSALTTAAAFGQEAIRETPTAAGFEPGAALQGRIVQLM